MLNCNFANRRSYYRPRLINIKAVEDLSITMHYKAVCKEVFINQKTKERFEGQMIA